jgi:hypothetical protein
MIAMRDWAMSVRFRHSELDLQAIEIVLALRESSIVQYTLREFQIGEIDLKSEVTLQN